jgi:hypothetical protein
LSTPAEIRPIAADCAAATLQKSRLEIASMNASLDSELR